MKAPGNLYSKMYVSFLQSQCESSMYYSPRVLILIAWYNIVTAGKAYNSRWSISVRNVLKLKILTSFAFDPT